MTTYLFISIIFCFIYIHVDFILCNLPLSEYVEQKDDGEIILRIIIFGLAWPIVVLFFLFVILNNIWKHILCLIYLHSIKRIIKKINKNIVNLKKKGEKNE